MLAIGAALAVFRFKVGMIATLAGAALAGLVLRLVLGGFVAHAVAAPSQAQGFRRLAGPQIVAAFSGKTFSDDVHFRDGKISGMSMGRRVANAWRVAKDELCVTDSFGEACYGVWRKGRALRLAIEGTDVVIEGRLR